MPTVNSSMQGKICMVTGANSGIGKATALALAQMGATVVMVCRDRARGEEAKSEIITKSRNNAVISCWQTCPRNSPYDNLSSTSSSAIRNCMCSSTMRERPSPGGEKPRMDWR